VSSVSYSQAWVGIFFKFGFKRNARGGGDDGKNLVFKKAGLIFKNPLTDHLILRRSLSVRTQ
jgi:hypothetical protein